MDDPPQAARCARDDSDRIADVGRADHRHRASCSTVCTQCGASMRPDAPSCADCGHARAPVFGTPLTLGFPLDDAGLDTLELDAESPAPAPTLMPGPPPEEPPAIPAAERDRLLQRKGTPTAVGAVVWTVTVMVGAIIATLALVSTGPDESPTASPAGGGHRETAVSTADARSAAAAPSSDPVPTDEDSARRMLEGQVANDRAQVEALTGYWVPQLSSKRPGLVANGITYDYRAIWSDYTNLRLRYPGALLLWSGDYSSFRYTDFWVTVSPHAYSSGEAANGWCDNAGIGKDDCYAKRITHTGGYAESTRHRK